VLGASNYADTVNWPPAFASEFLGSIVLVLTRPRVIHLTAAVPGFAGLAIGFVVFAAIIHRPDHRRDDRQIPAMMPVAQKDASTPAAAAGDAPVADEPSRPAGRSNDIHAHLAIRVIDQLLELVQINDRLAIGSSPAWPAGRMWVGLRAGWGLEGASSPRRRSVLEVGGGGRTARAWRIASCRPCPP